MFSWKLPRQGQRSLVKWTDDESTMEKQSTVRSYISLWKVLIAITFDEVTRRYKSFPQSTLSPLADWSMKSTRESSVHFRMCLPLKKSNRDLKDTVEDIFWNIRKAIFERWKDLQTIYVNSQWREKKYANDRRKNRIRKLLSDLLYF